MSVVLIKEDRGIAIVDKNILFNGGYGLAIIIFGDDFVTVTFAVKTETIDGYSVIVVDTARAAAIFIVLRAINRGLITINSKLEVDTFAILLRVDRLTGNFVLLANNQIAASQDHHGLIADNLGSGHINSYTLNGRTLFPGRGAVALFIGDNSFHQLGNDYFVTGNFAVGVNRTIPRNQTAELRCRGHAGRNVGGEDLVDTVSNKFRRAAVGDQVKFLEIACNVVAKVVNRIDLDRVTVFLKRSEFTDRHGVSIVVIAVITAAVNLCIAVHDGDSLFTGEVVAGIIDTEVAGTGEDQSDFTIDLFDFNIISGGTIDSDSVLRSIDCLAVIVKSKIFNHDLTDTAGTALNGLITEGLFYFANAHHIFFDAAVSIIGLVPADVTAQRRCAARFNIVTDRLNFMELRFITIIHDNLDSAGDNIRRLIEGICCSDLIGVFGTAQFKFTDINAVVIVDRGESCVRDQCLSCAIGANIADGSLEFGNTQIFTVLAVPFKVFHFGRNCAGAAAAGNTAGTRDRGVGYSIHLDRVGFTNDQSTVFITGNALGFGIRSLITVDNLGLCMRSIGDGDGVTADFAVIINRAIPGNDSAVNLAEVAVDHNSGLVAGEYRSTAFNIINDDRSFFRSGAAIQTVGILADSVAVVIDRSDAEAVDHTIGIAAKLAAEGCIKIKRVIVDLECRVSDRCSGNRDFLTGEVAFAGEDHRNFAINQLGHGINFKSVDRDSVDLVKFQTVSSVGSDTAGGKCRDSVLFSVAVKINDLGSDNFALSIKQLHHIFFNIAVIVNCLVPADETGKVGRCGFGRRLGHVNIVTEIFGSIEEIRRIL